MHLPDVNLWLALAFDAHFHHADPKSWFDALPNNSRCHFCRLTQQGFLRLATNPSIFGQDAVTLGEAWKLYDSFASDPRVLYADEPVGVETQWRAFTQNQSYSPAFAMMGGLEVVTFDRGFSRYPNLSHTILP